MRLLPAARPRQPGDAAQWPSWVDLPAADVPAVIEQVRAAVAAHASEALAVAEVAQGRQESAATELQRARALVERQHTAAGARSVLQALADHRGSYDEAAARVAAAERALAVSGHLAALEQAELDLAQALETVAARRREVSRRIAGRSPSELEDADDVRRLLELVEARQGPLDELGSCAATVTSQEAECGPTHCRGG